MKTSERIKEFFGLIKYSKYIDENFVSSNRKSGFWVSLVVSFLEIIMITSVLFNHFSGIQIRSTSWLISHLVSYWLLLLSSLSLLIITFLYLKNKIKSKIPGKICKFIFSVVALGFGIYISFLDYSKGEQFITFITMTIFTFCFFVWRPAFSISFLIFSFSLFFYLCNTLYPASYATKVNLSIALIAIILSAINAYHQKLANAKKDEKLNNANDILVKLSISDEVTGISNMNYFRSQTLHIMQKPETDITKYIFLFLDIEHFKSYNEKYGFWEGNSFLRNFAELIEKTFTNSVTAHFSNDNFVIFTRNQEIQEKLSVLQHFIENPKLEVRLLLKTGAFCPENKEIMPILACDHARYACYSIKKLFNKNYCEYDKSMAQDFSIKHYIINNLDNAIENNYIKVFYQPVIETKTRKICGLEALARWDDPETGFLSPAMFINTLEEYHQIHRLDMYIVEQVCIDLQEIISQNKIVIPVSLNFSRLDFDMIDLANEVENTLRKYNISKDYIHVEITESALTDNDNNLKNAIKDFRSSGYALWLDDFGAGYSGLNVLKDFDFDMMKIDMKFLVNFKENKKAKPILKNIVSLANDLGMKTLTEGVETKEAYEFLRLIGCEKMQGYLFGKPMPKNELQKKLSDGTYQISENLYKAS